jgi:DNA-binding NarL/FixJ family response regulator
MPQLSSNCAPNSTLHADAGYPRQVLLADEERLTALIAEGFSMPEIADRLGLPQECVQALLAQTLQKLGLTDQLELILYTYSNRH